MHLLPVLLLIPVLVACTNPLSVAPDLAGRTFVSTSVTVGGADRPLVPGTHIRLVFGPGDQLGASAGCNQVGGTWRVEDSRLVFEGGGMTEMGCDEARHAQDDWLVRFLASAPTRELGGNDLVLTAGDTVIRLVDREIAEPDQPLVGPVWTLDSIGSGDTVSSVPAGATATLAITPDGRARIALGCNTAGASVVVDGDRLRFTDMAVTRMLCDGPGGALEAAILPILTADTLTWRIDGSTLWLDAPGGSLGFRSG